jgi:hypothetical protein
MDNYSAPVAASPNIGELFSKQPANYHQNPSSKLVFFSFDPFLGQLVRNALFQFSHEFFDHELIADGGDLTHDAEILMLFDLAINQGKTIVLIGADAEVIGRIQNLWYQHPLSISFISDHYAPLQCVNLDSIYLKEVNVIGYQRQHPMIYNENLNYFRLGEYRNQPSCVEPALRRSELIYFNLNAIRSSDSPGSHHRNPSGLYSEEASSISRMAGMSDRLKLFVVSTWNENKDPDKITAAIVAQMIWYFWEGCHLKQLDNQIEKEQLTQYLVELKNLDYVIKFYKSEQSGKWWFEEPLIDNEFSNQLIPCSYDEYLATANDQIPERILEMINS